MSNFDKLFYMIFGIITLKIIGIVITDFTKTFQGNNTRNKILYGLASRKDLAKLSDASFIMWTINILKDIGFSSIKIMTYNLKESYQIKAIINGQAAYISCVKAKQNEGSNDEDDFSSIGRPELQKFVGTLEYDKVKIGYVLTNGDFAATAVEFAETMPSGYFLKLIDGCELTRLHRRNQKQYLSANLD